MIKNFINLSQLSLTTIARSSFSSHNGPTPTRLPKVSQKIIYIYVKNREGVYQKVPVTPGNSLLQALKVMNIRGFSQGICHGYDMTYRPHFRPHDNFTEGPNCFGCVVIFEDNWYNRVLQETDGMGQQEELLLKHFIQPTRENARLACCVPVEDWMDGMTLRIVPEQLEEGEAYFE